MTSSSSSTKSERRRPRSLGSLLSTTVTLMLTTTSYYGVDCFQLQAVQGLSLAEPRVTTRRFFRNTADTSASTAASTTTDALLAQNPFVHPPPAAPELFVAPRTPTVPQQQRQQQQQHLQPQTVDTTSTRSAAATSALPTWLAESKDALWESNWHTLEEAMLESFFTPQETQRLLQTIEIAAQGDRHQMASAAEFCFVLVETMEMGLTALMAGAHHVCACVTARLSALDKHQMWDHAFSAASDTTQRDHHSDHVALIAKDAGRLKQLEMVAAMIYSQKAASRVTPDAQDAENLRSLLLTETKDWRALAIRSAAALYRLRGILNHSKVGHVELTQEAMQCSREALSIYAPLASRLGMHRLKNELEGAAFRILYRRQYEKVNRMARDFRPRHSKPHLNRGLVEMCDNSLDISSCMKSVLETVKTDMSKLLREDAHFAEHVQDFSVTARVKEPYSLWKKMLRNRCQHIMEVPDAIALRIVFDAKRVPGEDDAVRRARERALCYYAQKLCLEQWQPAQDDARFKDYIESPKRNGYQSLHYTAHTMRDNEDWNLEIQVRSGEMHQVAEFGLASHWDYKAQQQQQQQAPPSPEVTISAATAYANDQSNDAYVRSVQEWHWQQHAGTIQTDDQWTTDSSAANVATPPLETSTETTERADRIRARTKKLQPYIEALTATQTDLARDHVFVFLTSEDDATAVSGQHGRVLSLPAGACVLDALREGEKELGFSFPDHHRLNGEASTKVTSKLQNGDILTVPLRGTVTASMA